MAAPTSVQKEKAEAYAKAKAADEAPESDVGKADDPSADAEAKMREQIRAEVMAEVQAQRRERGAKSKVVTQVIK